MSTICSVNWDDGVNNHFYDFLLNGITIWSDDTRQGWIKTLLILIDRYNIFASEYCKKQVADEHQPDLSALEEIRSGSVCIVADDNTSGCWKINDKGIAGLLIDGAPSRSNIFHFPQVQVASVMDAGFDSGKGFVSFCDGINTLILDCTRMNDYNRLSNIILETWNGRNSGNQIIVLVPAGNLGRILYDNLYNQLGGNRVEIHNGNKYKDICQLMQ